MTPPTEAVAVPDGSQVLASLEALFAQGTPIGSDLVTFKIFNVAANALHQILQRGATDEDLGCRSIAVLIKYQIQGLMSLRSAYDLLADYILRGIVLTDLDIEGAQATHGRIERAVGGLTDAMFGVIDAGKALQASYERVRRAT